MSARERILGRVREALEARAPAEHPGAFGSWRPGTEAPDPVATFAEMLQAVGGEVVRHPSALVASAWLAEFAAAFDSATIGETVPVELRPPLGEAPPEAASLGVSMARAAIAETGSLVMDARDGRRSQLLAPTHVVFVSASDIFPTFRATLLEAHSDLPSAIGLHSGPSKSQDIGHVMVTGVHGPSRLIAAVLEDSDRRPTGGHV